MATEIDTPKPEKLPAKNGRAKHPNGFRFDFFDALGALATAGTGMFAAFWSANASFFRNAHHTDGFMTDTWETLQKERTAAYKNNTGAKLIEAIETAEKKYTKTRTDKLVEKGFDGFEGTLRRWSTLRSHQKQEAILAFAIGSSVAVGIVASLLSNWHVYKQQEALEKRLDELDAQIGPQR